MSTNLPPAPRGPSKRVREITIAVACVVLSVVLVPVLRNWPLWGSGSSSHTVTYTVAGGQGASVTYRTGSQDSSQDTNAATPWTDEVSMSSGDFFYVSAQDQGSGVITCSVDVDGAQVDSNSSSGPYAICTASGTV